MGTRYFSSLTISLIFILVFSHPVYSQNPEDGDRLAQVRDLVDNNDLILIWSQGENQNEHFSHQRIYNLDMTQSTPEQRLVAGEIQTDSLVTGSRQMAVASGNFLGEAHKHFVAAWPGPENSITFTIPDIDSGTLNWTDTFRFSLPGPLAAFGSREIHLATGDFFGSERADEFVLGFQGDDNMIHLQVFSFDQGNLMPEPRGSINDGEVFNNDGVRHESWDIVSGDFNGNGHHEIALLFVKSLGGSNWALTASIYSVNEQGELIPEASKEIFFRPDHTITSIDISGSGDDFNVDPNQEIAFGFTFAQLESGNDTHVYILDIVDNLKTIVSSDVSRISEDAQNESEITPFNIDAGDLNGDFRNEIVLVTAGSTRIYAIDNELIPELRLTRGAPAPSGGNEDYFLAVGDMDGSGRAEIVTATNFRELEPGGVQYFTIWVMSIEEDFSGSLIKGRKEFEEQVSSDTGYRNFAIALGDFSGDRTWLGSPVHQRRTGVLQPSVILHAPPVHYDILNSTVFDVSGCFPNQNCGFQSTYIQTTSDAQTVTIQHHEDWAASAGVKLTAPGSETKVEVTYGEKFSNTATSTETMTISSGRTATGDDWIFVSIYDIDFYEYPVFEGDDPEPKGHFLVSIPANIRPLWIEGKNDQALGNLFRPDHEAGNIMSYRSFDAEDKPDVDSHILDFQEQTVGATGSSFVSLEMAKFTENSAETSWEAGGSFEQTIGEGVDLYGIELGLHVTWGGSYNRGEIITQTVSVNESIEMRGDFGHVESQFGTSGTYQVQPYAYWTNYGSLTLDYKVSIPDGDNFWQDHYGGKTDLAFSLPWRYDEQKGIPFPGDDPSYVERTRDIALSEIEPVGGDTVTIGARIRNMGLEAVTSPVAVNFYLNNPLFDGTPISEALIDTVIDPRNSHNVFVEWIVPAEMGSAELNEARIYAVIDPENNINNEIHDDNNLGWAPVVSNAASTTIPTSIHTGNELPRKAELHAPYPNPFNPTTTIQYSIGDPGEVVLQVFNVLGQKVTTLHNGMQTAGNHQVVWDASRQASGLYFVILRTNQALQTQKVMLIK